MAVSLSLEQAPPFAAPLRFFLTAPLFGMAAALLLVLAGGEIFASRWTPAALALTHLVTVGFMLQVMIGALFQLLPVAAGATLPRPLPLARFVHAALAAGALLLAAAFLTHEAVLFALAAAALGAGVLVFVAAAGWALSRIDTATASVRDIRRALFALTLTLALGLALAAGLAGVLELPLLQLADIHLAWGLAGWGGLLLAGVAYIVVPMFQLTPAYPAWFERWFSLAALAFLLAWSAFELAGRHPLAQLFAAATALGAGTLAAITLWLQTQSKRAKLDTTQQCWRFAMGSTIAGCLLWLLASALLRLGDARPQWMIESAAWSQFLDGSNWTLLFGVLILAGGFMTAINGMLYKILPFLVWLHARNAPRRVKAVPNMRQVLGEPPMLRQARAHFLACALLALAALWPAYFALLAGLALFVAQALLLANLLKANAVYRVYLQEPLASARSGQPGSGQAV